MGSSLKVSPFNMLPDVLKKDTTRVLLNMEEVGNFKFSNPDTKDIFVEGNIDESIKKILKDCEWEKEFDEFVEKEKKIYEEKVKK